MNYPTKSSMHLSFTLSIFPTPTKCTITVKTISYQCFWHQSLLVFTQRQVTILVSLFFCLFTKHMAVKQKLTFSLDTPPTSPQTKKMPCSMLYEQCRMCRLILRLVVKFNLMHNSRLGLCRCFHFHFMCHGCCHLQHFQVL
jgi:hypothetical protein